MVAAKLFIGNAEFVGIAWSPDRELEFSIVGCPLALYLTQSRLNQPYTSLAKPDSNIVLYIGKFSPGQISPGQISPGQISPKRATMYCAKTLPDLISPHMQAVKFLTIVFSLIRLTILPQTPRTMLLAFQKGREDFRVGM